MSAAGWGFGDLEGGGPGRGGGRIAQARKGRLRAPLEGVWREGGTPLRRWRLPGRGGAGPGQEEVSAPGHPPRGGFPESSRRERASALRPGAGGGGGERGKEGGGRASRAAGMFCWVSKRARAQYGEEPGLGTGEWR